MARVDLSDTIAAISSPPGPALRGLVRLSGPDSWNIAQDLFTAKDARQLPRRPELLEGEISLDGFRPQIPAKLALWPGTTTFTGEPLAEIHVVGAEPILNLLLADLLRKGARLAEPGEFTLRAFLNGKLDLTRAEAVLGVIEATSQGQLDAALQQLAGGIVNPIQTFRDRILDLLAHLEAGLDFIDEADVDPIQRASLAVELQEAAVEIRLLSEQITSRDRPAAVPRVVLVGVPNAGKSCLFNALSRDAKALVSPVAGTTRDYLSASCDCDGLIVELVDTAGAETPRTEIEAEAQAAREDQIVGADLVLDCTPAGDSKTLIQRPQPSLHILTKSDLNPHRPPGAIVTSAPLGLGLDEVRSAIARLLQEVASDGSAVAGTSARCQGSLASASLSLDSASRAVLEGGGDELVAIDLRQALDDLGRVIGAVVADDILDRIFRRFCIGK